MKRPLCLFASLMVSIATLPAKSLINVDSTGVGIKGYDPVAYFTDQSAIKGDPALRSTNAGVIYLFATRDHQQSFDDDPSKYTPAFGGFCAYGVLRGVVIPIDPTAFQIVNGKLLLQYSAGIMKKFNQDPEGNLGKAQSNWPLLLEKKGK